MSRQTALVTGATGFIGAHLVRHLLVEGWAVHVIARPESSFGQLTSAMEQVVIHRIDGHIASLQEAMRQARPDVVFHLASLFRSEHGPQDILPLIESNLGFGTQLVEAMCLEDIRCLVNTGTSWQHFENRDYSPVNLYAATKQAFEVMLQYYVEARDLRVVTLELCDTYGPDDPRKKLVKLLLNAARMGEPLALSPGEQSIDMVHVEDVVRAYVGAANLLHSKAWQGHQHFAVSSGRPLSLRAFVAELEQALDVRIPVVWGGRPYRQREAMKPWLPSQSLPGWEPRIALHDGLRALR